MNNKMLESDYIKKLQLRNKRGNLFLVIQTYLNYLIDGGKKDLFNIIEESRGSVKTYYNKELKKLDLYNSL